MSMESVSSQQPNNGIHRDDDYRKRILQSTCAFYSDSVFVSFDCMINWGRHRSDRDRLKGEQENAIMPHMIY